MPQTSQPQEPPNEELTCRATRARRWLLLTVLAAGGIIGCAAVIMPRNNWSEEWGPMVPHETFPADCSECHGSKNWTDIKEDFTFDHGAETGLHLVGAHNEAQCLRCHNDRGPVSAYLDRGCGGCHSDPHKSALGNDCQNCHNEHWWQPDGLIAEHAKTSFPLVGAHGLAACETCHDRAPVGDYRGTPTECHHCHQREAYLAQPNHAVNQWVRGCEECHDVADWRAVNFTHSTFPLVGGHVDAQCTSCHVGGLIAGTPTDCYSCHQNDYVNAADHVTNGLSTNCTDCHDTVDWTVP